jgi:oxygen-independent coproporphyrinogen-3 oxidase
LLSYKHAGITRISLGVQSFQDEKLKALGRIHSTKEIYSALEKIINVGFNSFNIDLIYNLPKQSLADAIFDLQTAISFSPKHISWYELTIEPKTLFARKNINQPSEETSLQIQEQGQALLQQAGFIQYEISAFAKPLYECLHNINYWQFGDYLGIGAGAHSKITDYVTGIIYRTIKKQAPRAYLNSKQNFIAKEEILSPKQIPLEFMLNALRLTNGFEKKKKLYQERTNLPLTNINVILEKASNLELLHLTSEKIIPTTLGNRFLNDLLQLFVSVE